MKFEEKEVLQDVKCAPNARICNILWKNHRTLNPTQVFVHDQCMNFDVNLNPGLLELLKMFPHRRTS